ncbi:hypothetical protein [Sphingomonas koreensis]
MIARLLMALSLAASASPVRADTTAVYIAGADDLAMTTTIEVADNGDARSQMSGPLFDKLPKGVALYTITTGGEDFIINEASEGISVIRLSDAMAVMAEHWAEANKQSGATEVDAEASDMALVARGEQTVNGRSGTAYYLRSGGKSSEPMLVISRDPALAQLGRFMARQFGKSIDGMQAMGVPGKPSDSMLKALNEGAPLVFAGVAKLQSVQHNPIPAARFVLPAPPKTLDETRALMTRKPPAR